MTTASYDRPDARTAAMYAALEEGIVSRDQETASDVLYNLIRAGRPLDELVLETVRIHGPYTQTPFHQRLDDGFVRFVNNDHCLLSGRLAMRMPEVLSKGHRFLPIAQTMWYVPTGLDAWNQLLGKAPGHYGRSRYDAERYPVPPAPLVHQADHPPLENPESIGGLDAQLNEWLTLVMRSQPEPAYRLLKAMLRDPGNRERVAAQMVFAGLIDIQDRMLYVTSYTTGHKSFRARATVELADAVGWDRADPIIYAGAPDLAVGPHYYANYEMACRVMMTELDDNPLISTLAATPESSRDAELFRQEDDLSIAEREGLLRAVLREPDPSYIHAITGLLQSGRSPKKILDTIQIAASQVVLEAGEPENFGMPQHCYEYTNTLAWFYNRFTHRHRTKLLFVAGSFVNQASMKLRNTPGNGRPAAARPGRLRPALARPGAAAAGGGDGPAGTGRGRIMGAGLPRRWLRARAAARLAGDERREARQRPAQPGTRHVLPRGLRAHEFTRTPSSAARLREAHRRTPQVRRLAGALLPLLRGLRCRRPRDEPGRRRPDRGRSRRHRGDSPR